MWEIVVENKISGECDTIFGYNFEDACRRNKYNPADFILCDQWYVD